LGVTDVAITFKKEREMSALPGRVEIAPDALNDEGELEAECAHLDLTGFIKLSNQSSLFLSSISSLQT
jgi:hypothetical protein